jgi:hypothetical protein
MNILIEVTENGILRLSSPEMSPGTKFLLPIDQQPTEINVQKQWEIIEEAIENAEKKNIPERSQEDIINQIRSYRD